MRLLITGCAGFIGYHLTLRMLSEGHTVTGIDNLNDYYDPNLKRSRLQQLGVDTSGIDQENLALQSVNGLFTFICVDVADNESLQLFLDGEKFDAVCHLAAQAGVRYSIENPQAYITSNLVGFSNILEFCRQYPNMMLVYASSSSVYGANNSIPYQESDRTDSPVSLYAATKKANEVMAYSYSHLYGIESVGLRFFTVYGPWGRPDMAPFIFTSSILEGKPIMVNNNGDMQRDFTYIDDIVEGISLIIKNPPATRNAYTGEKSRIYNIGNCSPVDLEQFISVIEKVSGVSARREYQPMQPGDVKATWADTTLLQEDYNYSPSTPLAEGLRNFVDWYRNYYNI